MNEKALKTKFLKNKHKLVRTLISKNFVNIYFKKFSNDRNLIFFLQYVTF